MPLSNTFRARSQAEAERRTYRPELGIPIAGAPTTATRTQAAPNKLGVAAFGNLSQLLGGGQYNIAQNPSQLIKNERGFQTYQERAAVRGPYATSSVGIDHIIPLSLGGTNDLSNIQLLPKATFDKKTAYDNLAAALYRTGHISLAEARNFNKNWNNNPTDLIGANRISRILDDPRVPDTVTLEGKTYNLKDILRKPELTYKVTPGKVLKEIPQAAADLPFKVFKALPKIADKYIGAPLFGVLSKVINKENAWDAMKRYQAEVDSGELEKKTGIKSPYQGPLMEAPKRLLQSLSFGYLNPTPEDLNTEQDQFVGKLAGLGGHGLGMALNVKGLAQGVSKLANTRAFAPVANLLTKTSVAKAISATPLVKSTLQNAGLFALYGQLHKQEPGKFADLENRAHLALHDIINGGVFSLTSSYFGAKFPVGVPGYKAYTNATKGMAGDAFLGYVTSKMQGASDEDALMNAGVFGALHGYGLYETRLHLQAQVNAVKEANNIFRQFGINKKVTNVAQAERAFTEARSVLAQNVADGYMTHQEAIPWMQQATVAYKTLSTVYSPFRVQVRKQMQDLGSAYVASREVNRTRREVERQIAQQARGDSETVRFAQETRLAEEATPPTERFANLAQEAAQSIQAPGTAVTADLEGRFMSTGMAESTNSIANRNQRMVIEMMNKNPEAKIDFILEREKTNPKDPNAVAIKAVVDDGRPIPLGYVAREKNIVEHQNTKPWVGENPDQYPRFNPATNNELFAGQMDALGVTRVRAELETMRESRAAFDQQGRGEPFLIMKVPMKSWEQATAYHDQMRLPDKPLIQYNQREEYLKRMPNTQSKVSFENFLGKIDELITNKKGQELVDLLNTYGDVVSPEMKPLIVDNIDRLTYENVMSVINEAAKSGRLNPSGQVVTEVMDKFLSEFAQVHGSDEALRFLGMPATKTPGETVSTPAPAANVVATPTTAQTVKPAEQKVIPAEEAVPVTTPPEEVMRKTQEAAEQNPTAKNVFLNQALDTGTREVVPNDYNTFSDNGKLTGISKRVVNKIVELLNGGVDKSDPEVTGLFNFYNNLTREKMRVAAHKSDTFEDFLDRYVSKAESLNLEPFDKVGGGRPIANEKHYDTYSNEQLQEFKHRYYMLKQTPAEARVLTIQPTAGGVDFKIDTIRPDKPASWLQNKVERSPYKGIEILRVRDDKNISPTVKLKGSAGEQVKMIGAAMRKKNIFMISDQNGDVGNTQGIHISPENYRKMLEKYNSQPDKYAPTDPEIIENMKTYLTTGDKISDDMKVMQVFYQDVLHLGQNVDAAMITKRINLLDHRDIQYDKPGKMQVLFFPATELAKIQPELPDFVQKNPEKYKELLEKFREDGARFMFPEDMQQIRLDLGYTGTSKNIKGTVVFELPEGGVMAEKGNTGTLHSQLRQYLEKTYKVTLEPGQIVSFMPNVKLGEGSLRELPSNPEIKYLDINKDDMRYLFENPKNEQEGTFSLGTLGKFSGKDIVASNGVTNGIKDDLVNMFKPAAEKWTKAWNEVYVDGQNPVQVFEKYYGTNLEEVGFGKLKAMARNGADIVSLRKQFENNMLSQFRNTVMKNRNLKSGYLKLIPDMGFWDPVENKYRMLKQDEVMMSREMWRELGSPEHVLTSRFPITKKLALSKLKVLVAEEYGINALGKDDIIDNVFDVYVRKEGDWDGDGLTVHSIIPKDRADKLIREGKELDGIPETVADHIEQDRARYVQEHGGETNPQGIEGAKYPRLPASNLEGLLYVASRAADAKQQLGGISNNSNLASMFVDNSASPLARQVFTVDGVYYPPKVDSKVIDSIGQMLQAAVDATGKDAFSKMSKVEKDPLSYIFNTTDERVLAKLSQNIYKTYMAGLRLNKVYPSVGGFTNRKGEQVPGLVKDINAFLTVTPDDPALRHPMQEVMATFKNLYTPEITTKHIWDSDQAAVEKVRSELKAPEMTEKAKKFIDFLNRQQDLKASTNQRLKQASGTTREELLEQYEYYRDSQHIYDYYYHNADTYSKADREAISWYLVTNPNGNWWYDKNYAARNSKTGYYVERFDDLFVPEHAHTYYAGRQQWFNENLSKNTTPTLPPPAPISQPVQLPDQTKTSPLSGFSNLSGLN